MSIFSWDDPIFVLDLSHLVVLVLNDTPLDCGRNPELPEKIYTDTI